MCLAAICKLANEAILRDLLNFEPDNVKNRNKPRSVFEVDNIKTETSPQASSIFEVDNIKKETILRDFLQKWKVECRAHGLVPIHFAIFPLHLSKGTSHNTTLQKLHYTTTTTTTTIASTTKLHYTTLH